MRFLSRPFTWLVLAELAVVGAVAIAAWHVVQSRLPVATAAAVEIGQLPSAALPRATLPSASPPLAIATAAPKRAGPTPGLALSSTFLNRELSTINRDQSAWEHSEWGIIQAVLGFARAYVDEVVLPGVRAAEAAGR